MVLAGEPGSGGGKRPGGRSARVRGAVLEAAGDALAESGVDGLDPTDVAHRAGVGRTTVYRRWGSVPALVADLLEDMAEQPLSGVETGPLLKDLTASAQLVRETLAHPRQGPLFKAAVAAATCDERTVAALHRFYDVRIREWAPCVEQAVERDEIPEGTDAQEVIRAVSAPRYLRLLASGDLLDEGAVDRSARAAVAAARAGVYVR